MTVSDVFYFGNAIGDGGNQTANAIVNATDEIAARSFSHSPLSPAAIDDPYDYSRDRLVNGTDRIIARNNRTNPLTMLRLITAPAADAAIKQMVEQDSRDSESMPAALAWLTEFEHMSSTRSSTKNNKTAEQAVDELLTTYW